MYFHVYLIYRFTRTFTDHSSVITRCWGFELQNGKSSLKSPQTIATQDFAPASLLSTPDKENPVAVTVTGFLFFLSTHKSTHFSFCLDDFRKCLFSKGSCLCQISGHLMPVGPLSIHILTVSDCHFLQSLRHLFVDADIGVPEFVERYHGDIIGRAVTSPTTVESVSSFSQASFS